MRQYQQIDGRLYSDEAVEFIKQSAARGSRLEMEVGDEPAACEQCLGMGYVVIAAYDPQPVSEFAGDRVIGYVGNDAHYCTKKVFPCVACNSQLISDARMRCIATNGLNANEQAWSLDYLKGKPGKTDLVKYAGATTLTHSPTGFSCLYGGYGVGKSGAAKAIVASLSQRGVRAIYTTMSHVVEQARATFSDGAENDHESERAVIAYYNNCRFLVLDEVDRVNAKSAWVMEFVFSLINARYDRRSSVATLLITNSMPDEMGQAWAYLESRLKDGSRIIVGGADTRGKAA